MFIHWLRAIAEISRPYILGACAVFFFFMLRRLYLLCWDFIYFSSWPGFEVTTDSGSSNHRTQSHTDRLRPYWPLLLAPTGEPTSCWG